MRKQVLLFLLLCVPLLVFSAPKKTFSKKYKDTRLEEVLNDVCKRFDYRLVVDPSDIDMDKRITYTFKNASAGNVLRRVLDKDLTYKIKKGAITINKKPSPPTVYTSRGTSPASVEENDSLKLTFWTDTVFSVTCKTVTVESKGQKSTSQVKKKSSSSKKSKGSKSSKRSKGKNSKGKNSKSSTKAPTKAAESNVEKVPYKGHHIQFALGGAYADLGYSLRDANGRVGREHGSFGGVAEFKYAYFFHENWGIGLGVGFSHYTGYGILTQAKRFAGQTDTDGEAYTHLAVPRNWTERQAAYMIDIPLELQFHYPLNDDLGLYGGAGLKAGLILASDWRLKKGGIEHQGEYEKWGLTVDNMPNHGFYTEQIGTDFSTAKQPLNLKMPAIGVLADFGVSVKLTEQLNLLVGAFFNYTCMDVRPAGVTELGWKQTQYSGAETYRNHDFMNTYAGEITSDYVKAVRPWEVGIKVGIDWRHKPKAKPAPIEYTRIQVCDTTVTLQQRVDTVHKPKQQAVREIVRLMETSVIWYDLDSSEPKLKPADILDKIAAILIANPDQKILINGHASKEGSALHNKRLSENRAKVIYDLLLQKGVNADQMKAKGYGVEKSYQEGEHEISLDRRVEIIPVYDK